MSPTGYHHSCEIQIRFNDIDKVGHVNNAVYHSYLELGRLHYFNDVLERTVEWDKKGFVLARTEIDYRKPIFLRDSISCYTKLEQVGTKSFKLRSSICRRLGDQWEECANALTTLVCMDYTSFKSIEIPPDWLRRMTQFEQGNS